MSERFDEAYEAGRKYESTLIQLWLLQQADQCKSDVCRRLLISLSGAIEAGAPCTSTKEEVPA